jgi:sodium transport system permease protein
MRSNVSRTALAVAGKELRSALRDRQTIVYMIVLPLALYPVIFWVMLQGFTYLRGRDEATVLRVDVVGAPRTLPLARVVDALEEPSETLRNPGGLEVRTLPAPADAEALLRSEASDGAQAVLDFSGDAPLLFWDATRSASELARARVAERLERASGAVRRDALSEVEVDPATLAPFRLDERDVAGDEERGGFQLSFLLPMMFAFMAVLGAFYPAVDTTAGEKERGTAETTLLLPVPRLGVSLGKVLAIAAAASIATALNLIGMALAAESLFASLHGAGGLRIDIPWIAFVEMAPICFVFVLSVSAVLFTVASFAKTFKQGQSMLGAVQLVVIVPALAGALPGLELTPELAFVPVLQTVLAMKTILQSTGLASGEHALELGLVYASQLVYAALALLVSTRLASRESLTFGDAGLGRALRLLRSAGTPR